jgi:hypothetical protein
MVDTELLIEKGTRGLFVGAGSFLSSWVGSQIADFSSDLGDQGVAVAKIGLGVGASVVAGDDDLLIDLENRQGSMQSEALEYAGYGMTGAGFAELGESFNLGFDGNGGGSSSRRKSRRVRKSSQRSRRTSGRNVSKNSGAGGGAANTEEFLIDA